MTRIQGEEALRLDDILQGRDTKKESSTQTTSSTTTETTSSSNQVLPSSIQSSSSNPSSITSTSTSESTASQPRIRSEVLAAIAQERVRAMISEMNQERTSGRGIGLEGEGGGSEGWSSPSSSGSVDSRSRPRGESGDEGDALGAASRLAELLERAGAGVDTKE